MTIRKIDSLGELDHDKCYRGLCALTDEQVKQLEAAAEVWLKWTSEDGFTLYYKEIER